MHLRHRSGEIAGAEQEKLGLLEEQSVAAAGHPAPPIACSPPPSSAATLVRRLGQAASSRVAALWRPLLCRALVFLVPSFLHHRLLPGERGRPDRKLHPTAYLDGMRGLASLFVYFNHYTFQAFRIDEAYGNPDSPTGRNLLKLPIVRLLYNGPPAVCVFFVISGYAISCKALRAIRAGAMDDFATTLSSMTFRRYLRLYLPAAASSLLVVVLLRLGAYEATREFAKDRRFIKLVSEPHAPLLATASAQLADWAWAMFRFVHIFGWDRPPARVVLDVHLWTIPIEFRCSMYVFAILVGVARVRPAVRISILAGLIGFCFRRSRWELVLFIAGVMIAELDLICQSQPQSQPQPLPPPPSLASSSCDSKAEPEPAPPPWWRRHWATALGWAALYLMSYPGTNPHKTAGWRWIASSVPAWWEEEKFRVPQSVGAVLFVLAATRSLQWQRFFNTGPVQYLGQISYALYLVHGPVTHTAGYMLERAAWGVTGVEGQWYNVGFGLSMVPSIPIVIWAADVFWRAVDMPSVRFARWLEGKCLPK